MTIKRSIALATLLASSTLHAQAFGPLGQQTPNWVINPTIGFPGNTVAGITETFTTAQGSVPPAAAQEPAPIDEAGHYVRSQWLASDNLQRIDSGEAKFRTKCTFAKFGTFDPILGPGMTMFGHDHTFFGNIGITANSDYSSLRAAPASTCEGGPLNATGYWTTTLLYERLPGVIVPVKPNLATFYYTVGSYVGTDKRIRLFNNEAFIGGVNPRNRSNSDRVAEIPATGFASVTNNPAKLDGWYGWQCVRSSDSSTVNPTGPGVYPALSTGFSRNLVNPDGSDPWNGQCEGPNYIMIANITAPRCWDGKNLRSPDGRAHMRHPLNRSSDDAEVCPQNWYWQLHFEVKEEYPAYTFAMRQKMFLSSDHQRESDGAISTNPADWATPGSTKHFDWYGAWDRPVFNIWQRDCGGVVINGQAASDFPNGRTCGTGTISATQRLISGEAPPVAGLSQNPVTPTFNFGAAGTPSKTRFGKIRSGTVNATIGHAH